MIDIFGKQDVKDTFQLYPRQPWNSRQLADLYTISNVQEASSSTLSQTAELPISQVAKDQNFHSLPISVSFEFDFVHNVIAKLFDNWMNYSNSHGPTFQL